MFFTHFELGYLTSYNILLERNDLGRLDDDFESIWTELKNKKGKNFLCGCLYQHPNTDTAKFMEYIESTLTKIDKNKYAVFLMGDFNIDLLKYESNSLPT